MNGHDTFQAFQTIAVVAQVAAAFGVFIKSRNKEFKNMALSAGLTGLFGITEPTIYGVTLRLKKPFICGCVGGAIGAVVMSFFHSAYYAYAGLPGPLTIVNMELQEEVIFDKNEEMKGRELYVFIEGQVEDDNAYVGRTYRDAPDVDGYIFINTDETLMTGDIVKVKVTGAYEYDLIGEICQ